MIHKWSMTTDSTGAAVRILLLDYRKAFDLIYHRILIQKIYSLRVSRGVSRWTCDFLVNREQRIKPSRDCFWEWGHVPSGVPRGKKLGPWLFILMINDLNPPRVSSRKYVDDTTSSWSSPKGHYQYCLGCYCRSITFVKDEQITVECWEM